MTTALLEIDCALMLPNTCRVLKFQDTDMCYSCVAGCNVAAAVAYPHDLFVPQTLNSA